MKNPTQTPTHFAADASGWSREYPTRAAAIRGATYRARWSGQPCWIEGDSEPTMLGLAGGSL
jgi:hypothetical protein